MQRVVLQQSHPTLCRLLQVEAREINAIWHEASLWATAWQCNRCIVVDLCCDCEACSLDAPEVVTPDTAPDISEPT